MQAQTMNASNANAFFFILPKPVLQILSGNFDGSVEQVVRVYLSEYLCFGHFVYISNSISFVCVYTL